MNCAFCNQPSKRFRMIPAPDGKHQAQWCQKCPDPRYKPRAKKEEVTATTQKGTEK